MFNLLAALFLIFTTPSLIYAHELKASFAIGVVTQNDLELLVSTTKKILQDDVVLICSPIK